MDPTHLQQLAETDRRLRSIVLALRGMRPPRFADLFETFASVIPFQQLSLDAGVAILGRLVECFGESLSHGGHHYPELYGARIARLIERLRTTDDLVIIVVDVGPALVGIIQRIRQLVGAKPDIVTAAWSPQTLETISCAIH